MQMTSNEVIVYFLIFDVNKPRRKDPDLYAMSSARLLLELRCSKLLR